MTDKLTATLSGFLIFEYFKEPFQISSTKLSQVLINSFLSQTEDLIVSQTHTTYCVLNFSNHLFSCSSSAKLVQIVYPYFHQDFVWQLSISCDNQQGNWITTSLIKNSIILIQSLNQTCIVLPVKLKFHFNFFFTCVHLGSLIAAFRFRWISKGRNHENITKKEKILQYVKVMGHIMLSLSQTMCTISRLARQPLLFSTSNGVCVSSYVFHHASRHGAEIWHADRG